MHSLSESLDYLFTGQWDGVFYTNKRFLLYSQAQFLQLVWVPPYKPERTDGLIYKLTVTMAKCSDVMILAKTYFTHNVFGKCLRILYTRTLFREIKTRYPFNFFSFYLFKPCRTN